MASIGVGLTAQLGAEFWALVLHFIGEFALVADAVLMNMHKPSLLFMMMMHWFIRTTVPA